MLTQSDVVKLMLAPNLPQNEAYQILAAYTFSKSSHGNLPSETLGKIYSIHRKLILAAAAAGKKPGDYSTNSNCGRAFEAIKTQLNAVSRRYLTVGVASFGPLGKVGNASGEYAISAWTKATDGKIKNFNTSQSLVAVDAGRVPIARQVSDYDGPPLYVADIDADETNVPAVPPVAVSSIGLSMEDIEIGRARLALMKAEMLRRTEEDQELSARLLDGGNNPLSHGMRTNL